MNGEDIWRERCEVVSEGLPKFLQICKSMVQKVPIESRVSACS
jgi:hypothetical protein